MRRDAISDAPHVSVVGQEEGMALRARDADCGGGDGNGGRDWCPCCAARRAAQRAAQLGRQRAHLKRRRRKGAQVEQLRSKQQM
eukprot:6188379-Pleurochrysis_carterae.AAC.3